MGGAVVRSWSAADRRQCHRWRPSQLAWLASARLRTGRDIDVVNLSAGGALVEGGSRLLPGSRLTLQLAGPGACLVVAARVLRCEIVSISAYGGARYRGAVAFESPLTIADALDPDGNGLPSAVSCRSPDVGNSLPEIA